MTSLVVHFCSAPLVCFVDTLDSGGGQHPHHVRLGMAALRQQLAKGSLQLRQQTGRILHQVHR